MERCVFRLMKCTLFHFVSLWYDYSIYLTNKWQKRQTNMNTCYYLLYFFNVCHRKHNEPCEDPISETNLFARVAQSWSSWEGFNQNINVFKIKLFKSVSVEANLQIRFVYRRKDVFFLDHSFITFFSTSGRV